MLAGFSRASLPLATVLSVKPPARMVAGVPEGALAAGTPVLIWATATAVAASPATATAAPGTILRNVYSFVEGDNRPATYGRGPPLHVKRWSRTRIRVVTLRRSGRVDGRRLPPVDVRPAGEVHADAV